MVVGGISLTEYSVNFACKSLSSLSAISTSSVIGSISQYIRSNLGWDDHDISSNLDSIIFKFLLGISSINSYFCKTSYKPDFTFDQPLSSGAILFGSLKSCEKLSTPTAWDFELP